MTSNGINKKLFLTIAFAVSILLAGRVVFAVWDGSPYDPGETLDPECLPTDVDCDVAPGANSTLSNLGTTDINASLLFDTDATYDIGSSSVGINDLHFGSGGVLNFDGGDVTITHSADVLAFAGASSGYTFDALTTITAIAGGSQKALVVNNSTSTGNIFEAQDNGTAVVTIADGGKVGIGTTTPTAQLDILVTNTTANVSMEGIQSTMTVSPSVNETPAWSLYKATAHNYISIPNDSTNDVSKIIGGSNNAENYGTGDVGWIHGGENWAYNVANTNVDTIRGAFDWAESDAGSVTNLIGLDAGVWLYGGTTTNMYGLLISGMENGGGVVTNRYGINIASPVGAATNHYGIFINDQSPGGADSWSFYADGTAPSYFEGYVGMGTTDPTAPLEVVAGTNADSDYYTAIFTGNRSDGWGGVLINSEVAGGGVELGLSTPNNDGWSIFMDDSDGALSFWDLTGGGNRFVIGQGGSNNQVAISGTYEVDTTAIGKLNISGTLRTSDTGQANIFINQTVVEPTGASVSTIYGLINLPTIGASTPVTLGEVIGTYGRVDTTAAFNKTITTAKAFEAGNPSVGGGIISNSVGIQVAPQTAGTNNAGLIIGEATGVNHTNLVIGQTSIPSGGYSIYNSSTDPNYFAGNLGVGVVPSVALDVLSQSEELINVSMAQSTNDHGAYITFKGGLVGSTNRGFLGYTKTGAGSATLFSNEVADYLGLLAVNGLHLGTNSTAWALRIMGRMAQYN